MDFFVGDPTASTNVTEDRRYIPAAISDAPKYQDTGTNSPKKSIPYIAWLECPRLEMTNQYIKHMINENNATLTEHEKFAAVDRAVPTTLPLSFIPSKNELIMMALTPTMHKRQRPRVASDAEGHIHDNSS